MAELLRIPDCGLLSWKAAAINGAYLTLIIASTRQATTALGV
jgi:hypothetical protein